MAERDLEKNVRQALEQVKHPEIDLSLLELGMIKDMTAECKTVTLTLVLPFLNRDASSMLKIENFSVKVHAKDILRRVSLEIKNGEVHALLGPNASGF